MTKSDDSPQPPANPLAQSDSDLAAEVIRQKIGALYQAEQKEPDAVAEEKLVAHRKHLTTHQRFMRQLSESGKSLAQIQTEWHQYYQQLPDDQKHQVWQEFYVEHARAKNQAEQAAPATSQPKKGRPQNVSHLKKQLLGKVSQRSQAQLKAKHHFQSILFGVGVGSLVVLIMLFGFFNERLIAPFITPSKTVTNTPIISTDVDPNGPPKVVIPKINVEIPVIYTQSSIDESAIQNSLEDGVVHYATTASPGEKGNTVIFGHSSNNILNKGRYKFAFVLLNRLQVGDTFSLTKDGKRYTYQVYERKIVKPTDISVLGATDKTATATLITCDPPGTSINRLVIIGEQISPDPADNGTSTAIKSDQTPAVVPSDAPSLWSRLTGWLSG